MNEKIPPHCIEIIRQLARMSDERQTRLLDMNAVYELYRPAILDFIASSTDR